MKRRVILYNRVINYSVRKSNRAKRMRLAVYCDGNFIVTVPQSFSINSIDRYIIAKSQWVISKIDFFEKLEEKQKLTFGNDGYELYREKALEMVNTRLTELNNEHFRYGYNSISVKNHKTRWGSCSKKRNLNFNYKILFLSPKIRDYIIIHELCHLKEFNHSRKFWREIEKIIPDYLNLIEDLRINGLFIV